MNQLSATGRIGKQPTLKVTTEYTVLSFPLAIRTGFGKNEVTTWIQCSMWGKRAEVLMNYLDKGSLIAINGSISQNSWQDENGNERFGIACTLSELTMLDTKKTAEDTSKYVVKPVDPNWNPRNDRPANAMPDDGEPF